MLDAAAVVEADVVLMPEVVPEVLAPGLLMVRYEEAEQLAPGRQSQLMVAVREAAQRDAVGILFVVGPNVQAVSRDVPKFWLEMTGVPEHRIRVIAIVSDSLGVRMAAKGFGVANLLRSVKIDVEAFQDLAAAKAWTQARLWNANLTDQLARNAADRAATR